MATEEEKGPVVQSAEGSSEAERPKHPRTLFSSERQVAQKVKTVRRADAERPGDCLSAWLE